MIPKAVAMMARPISDETNTFVRVGMFSFHTMCAGSKETRMSTQTPKPTAMYAV